MLGALGLAIYANLLAIGHVFNETVPSWYDFGILAVAFCLYQGARALRLQALYEYLDQMENEE